MNTIYNLAMMVLLGGGTLMLAVLYAYSWYVGRRVPVSEQVTKEHLYRVENLCKDVVRRFDSVLAMHLPLEVRNDVRNHLSSYYDTLHLFRKDDGLQAYKQTMDRIREQRKWIANFQDKLLTNSVKKGSEFHDYSK